MNTMITDEKRNQEDRQAGLARYGEPGNPQSAGPLQRLQRDLRGSLTLKPSQTVKR